ncbi:hypothetical protein OAA60_00875 [Porticoccaceae bacterium]|nr:hypothetical protein [Porticoccaceae bacterium]
MSITKADLERKVKYLNELTGHATEPYGERINGKINPNAGNYHLDWAYGGVKLAQMSLTDGCTGTSDPLSVGFGTKRECYEAIAAFVRGVEVGAAS